MNRDQAKEYVKGKLENYLIGKGINTFKPFHCLNPEHNDQNPSMSYDRNRNKVHCFACGVDCDTFDLIGLEYGISDPKEIFEKAYELFNVSLENNFRRSPEEDFKEHIERLTYNMYNTHNKSNTDYTQYCKERAEHIAETDYPEKRGLSEDTIKRFGLGYDPNFELIPGKAFCKALIIPTGKGCFVARNTDPNAERHNRVRKRGESQLFNLNAVIKADKPVFIVEGEIDALSVIEVGGIALGLGGVTNVKRFLNYIKTTGWKPEYPFLVSLDNDDSGEKAAEELLSGLHDLEIGAYKVNIAVGCKDANEALLINREAFKEAVQNAQNIESEARQAEIKEYLKQSTSNYLQDFINGIADSVDTPFIPTGFNQLDDVLDGGLYEGLYIVGAISSLGKTTFVCQIADQIAQSGHDVLIFSLEMARTEIMAKSISRLTLLDCFLRKAPSNDAKTTRGITTGKRYMYYSQNERDLINRSIKAYGEYAERLYISEGIGDIGVTQIRDTVKKHISITGNSPVVIIDYIQIIAPYSERATDKQNIDKAVIELKRISRDFKVPIIGISSFNRANYNTPVTMEAFKESGAIEYSSDVLIGLQLEGVGKDKVDVNAKKDKNPREIELVVLKNRNGATGKKVSYNYYPLFNYFKEG